jgi:hypothetical protein
MGGDTGQAGDDIAVPALEMTQAEYARHRGVRRQLVGKWVDAGRIPTVERAGRRMVDVVAADRALGETRERVVLRNDPEPGAPPAQLAGLTKAKTATEVYRARLAQLEYEERVGSLVPLDHVRECTTDMGHVLVRVFELPLMRAEVLHAEALKGMGEFRAALRELVREQRQCAVDEIAKLPALAAAKDDGGGASEAREAAS